MEGDRMKNYSLPTIYYLGMRKDGERKQTKFEGKATVYYDTITEYFDLPENESEEFINDYNNWLSEQNYAEPIHLEGEFPHWSVEVNQELLEQETE
jgi:hypothetical protein